MSYHSLTSPSHRSVLVNVLISAALINMLGSHPMDWFTSLISLTPDQNKEDLGDVDPSSAARCWNQSWNRLILSNALKLTIISSFDQ